MAKSVRLNHSELRKKLAWVYFALRSATDNIDHFKPSSAENLTEMCLGTVGGLLADVLTEDEKVKLYAGTLELEDIQED